MPTETKNHVVPSILDDGGNRQIIYARNTFDDVVVSDLDDTEDIGSHVHYYCVCDTAADVAAKVITVGNGDSTGLVKKGASFIVTFTNGNTATGATLSVNGGTAYSLIDVTESSISAAQTVTLLFDGTNFITGAGSGGTKVEESPVDPEEGEATTKYVAMVDGSSDNSSISYDPSYYADSDGLHGKVGATTVDFTDDAADANTDYRTSAALETGNSLSSLFQKVKKIFAGMGSLAFKSSVGTTELDATLSDAYTNRLSKSDLYNGTDYSGGAGNKALDASVGVTLQNSITSLNSKVQSFENTKSDIVGSALGGALGMSTTYTWDQVVSAITGVANRGTFSITFEPTTTAQSRSGSAGYYTQVYAACNAVSLSGNAGTGQVLSGYTFYNNSLTRQTGTMVNRGWLDWAPSGNTSYSLPAGYYSGGSLNTVNAYLSGLSVLNALTCTDVVSGDLNTSYNFWCPYAGRYLVIACSSRGSKGSGPASSITTNGTPITYTRWWVGGDSPSQVQCTCLHGLAFMFLEASVGTMITVNFASGYTSDGFAMVFKLNA